MTTLSNLRVGAFVRSEDVFVRAQTVIRSSAVPSKSSELRKNSVPPLMLELAAFVFMAGCTLKPGPSAWVSPWKLTISPGVFAAALWLCAARSRAVWERWVKAHSLGLMEMPSALEPSRGWSPIHGQRPKPGSVTSIEKKLNAPVASEVVLTASKMWDLCRKSPVFGLTSISTTVKNQRCVSGSKMMRGSVRSGPKGPEGRTKAEGNPKNLLLEVGPARMLPA